MCVFPPRLFAVPRAAGKGEGASSGGAVAAEGGGGGGGGGNDYFRKAHSKSEAVRQPSSLKGGTLKNYQLQGLQWMVIYFRLRSMPAAVSYDWEDGGAGGGC